MQNDDPERDDDPKQFTLEEWLARHGTRTGTFTINGVRYTDLNEVEWRRANGVWLKPEQKPGG